MKTCTICKFPKKEDDFNKNKSRKDGLNNICRRCSNRRSRKYYSNNIIKHREEVNKRKKSNRENNQIKLLELLKGKECTDCGTEDYKVFEFDHIEDNKFANISNLLSTGYRWEIIKKEIDKCEIVCANCHRLRTFKRNNNYRIVL